MKFKWEYKGRKLANPIVIVWRLLWYPVWRILHVALVAALYIGGQSWAAASIWEELK